MIRGFYLAAVRSSTLCATYKIYLQCVIKDIEVFYIKYVRALKTGQLGRVKALKTAQSLATIF